MPQNDVHDGTVAQGEAWLQTYMSGYVKLLPRAERTDRRARRIRRVGAIAGLLAGARIARGHHDSLGNSLAAPWVGYLAGLLVAELTLWLPKRATIRSATLTPRRMGQLSPPWWRVAGKTMLVLTAAAAPLVRLGRHPTGDIPIPGPSVAARRRGRRSPRSAPSASSRWPA